MTIPVLWQQRVEEIQQRAKLAAETDYRAEAAGADWRTAADSIEQIEPATQSERSVYRIAYTREKGALAARARVASDE